ncbi:LCP family protein [Streptomyces capparidis]
MHEGARTIDPTAEPGPAADGPGGSGGAGGHRRRGSRRRKKAKKGGRLRILKWATLGLSLLVLGTAGAGWLYINHLNGNIRKGERSSGDSDVAGHKPNADGQTPLNILLIGSDSRNTAENLKLGGRKADVGRKPLADVQMLLHVSADRSHAALLSIPRDTRVEIPKCRDPKTDEEFPATNNTINNTLARGGAGCTLATWQNLTGMYIDHWMMIDFAGVVSMADEVGGVEVCVNQNIWDRDLKTGRGGSGLKLEAGRKKVKGQEALQWLRTRYAWGSDIQRTKAQRMYMNSMVRELRSQSVFSDTGRLMGLAEAATNALQVSEEIGTVKKLYQLGMELKSVPPDRITSLTMPAVDDPQDRNHVIPAPGEADKVFAMLRNDVPLDANGGKKDGKSGEKQTPKDKGPDAAAPGGIAVSVVNGTGAGGQAPVDGRASDLVEKLATAGFTRAEASVAGEPRESTVVQYPKGEGDQGKANARSVAKALGVPEAAVQASEDVTVITLHIGADWREGTDYAATLPEEGDVPESSNALNGSDKGACMDVYEPYRW